MVLVLMELLILQWKLATGRLMGSVDFWGRVGLVGYSVQWMVVVVEQTAFRTLTCWLAGRVFFQLVHMVFMPLWAADPRRMVGQGEVDECGGTGQQSGYCEFQCPVGHCRSGGAICLKGSYLLVD